MSRKYKTIFDEAPSLLSEWGKELQREEILESLRRANLFLAFVGYNDWRG